MSDYNNGDSERISRNKALFKLAIEEAMNLKIRKIESEIKDVEAPSPSIRHRIQMNRLLRARIGGDFIPFPEADYSGET